MTTAGKTTRKTTARKPKKLSKKTQNLLSIAKICEALRKGNGTLEGAAKYLDSPEIDQALLYEKVKKNRTRFDIAKQEGLELLYDTGWNVVAQKVQEGNLNAVKYLFGFLARNGNTIDAFLARKSILSKLRKKEIDVTEAALEFEAAGIALPETVRILLAKTDAVQVDLTGGQYSTLSPQEFGERVKDRLKELQGQMDELSARREEVQALREQVADSFGQAEVEPSENGNS